MTIQDLAFLGLDKETTEWLIIELEAQKAVSRTYEALIISTK